MKKALAVEWSEEGQDALPLSTRASAIAFHRQYATVDLDWQVAKIIPALSMEYQKLLRSNPHIGQVRWIGVRPASREPLTVVQEVTVDVVHGLDGDRTDGGNSKKRQVTLIQFEHLRAMADILRRPEIDPGLLRRNIVVSGINLLALKNQYFQIGTAVLFGTADCPPCSRMEENLGPGGFSAMRGHGGLTASVHQSGVIRVGDRVSLWREAPREAALPKS